MPSYLLWSDLQPDRFSFMLRSSKQVFFKIVNLLLQSRKRCNMFVPDLRSITERR